jgi:predicted transcriptional regulator
MANTYAESVTAEVRAEMARQRLGQVKMAGLLGWTQATLSRRLTGDVPFATDEIDEVARALGVPVGQLVNPVVREATA